MSTKAARGKKQKCQNSDCAAPFYDLNRTAYACPTCGTAFSLQLLAQQEADRLNVGQRGRGMSAFSRRPAPVLAPVVEVESVDPTEAAVADIETESTEDEAVEGGAEILEIEAEDEAEGDFTSKPEIANDE